MEVARELIGQKVRKISGKPFKSGSKINTVSKITENPNTNNLAFSFLEDESLVDVYQCRAHIPRYLVFVGYSYDASICQGGARNFVESYSTYSEAVHKAKKLVENKDEIEEGIWSHIFDAATLKVVAEYGTK